MFQPATSRADPIPVSVRILAPVITIVVIGCAVLGLLVPPLPGPGPLAVWLGHAVRPLPGEMPVAGRPDIWLLPLLQLVALSVLVWRVVAVSSERRLWLLIALGGLVTTLAHLTYRWLLPSATAGELGLSAPQLGLIMYSGEIAFFALTFLAQSFMTTRRVGLPSPGLRLDGLVGACGVLTVGTALLVPDAIVYSMSGWAELGAVVVSITALAPLALLIGVVPVLGRNPSRAWWSMLAGILPATVAAGLTMHPLALGVDARTSPGWLLWPTAFLALAWTAWHMGPPPPRLTAQFPRSVVTPTVLSLAALIVLGVDRVTPQPPVVMVLAFLTVLTSLVRLVFALRSAKRLNAQHVVQQEHLRVARDEALAAGRARADFAATLSHEIRTPLSAVIGMSELLLSGRLEPGQREQADHVRRSATLILGLVNEVLDRASIDADQLSLDYQPLELAEVLGDVVELLQVNANAKGIRLQADLDPACPEWVRGDATRLRQVLINLLGNAIKFTDSGEVTVEICPAARLEVSEAVYFQVTDTGAGIPAGQLNRLFQPYGRVPQKGARKAGGTGLGLSISQALVHRMGGVITVTSQEGVGSVFGFELALPPEPMPESVATSLEGRTIAVLDPQPSRAEPLADRLRRWGATVSVGTETEGWVDALADTVVIREDHPDDLAVIGEQLERRADQTRPRLVIITASGHAVPTEHVRDNDLVLGATVSSGRLRAALVALVAAPEATVDEPEDRPMRILLAEDDPAARRVGQLMIQLLGHEVEMVADGAAAVEAAAATAYDLVLMDAQMPELDGVDAARAIRDQESPGDRVPIIALTGSASAADRERYTEAGMDATLVKPMSRAALQQVLADFPRRPAAKIYIRKMVA